MNHPTDAELERLRRRAADSPGGATVELLVEDVRALLEHQRPDAEALEAVPDLKRGRALVLYFPTDADRDGFVALIHEAKPGMRTVKL